MSRTPSVESPVLALTASPEEIPSEDERVRAPLLGFAGSAARVGSFMRTSASLPSAFAILALIWSPPLFAKDFSVRIVDGLGRPVSGVTVDVHWLRKDTDGEVRKAGLVIVSTDKLGVARGTFDEKAVPSDEATWIELSKPGYAGYTTDSLRAEFVLKRKFGPDDLRRIANLPDSDRDRELKELIAADFEGEDLELRVFRNEDAFRPALLRSITDPKVARAVFPILAFIGVPEDVRLIVQHAPPAKRELFEDRWAYGVATTLLEPTTEAEWKFLRNCALNAYDDLWVDAGAIQTLKLIASPRSLRILEEIRTENPDRAQMAERAIQYVKSNPAPLSDRNLTNLAERVAQAILIGSWKGNRPPEYNFKHDKALTDIEFRAGRDALVHTATFHKVGDVWKLRGVRETMQALLALESEPKEKGAQK